MLALMLIFNYIRCLNLINIIIQDDKKVPVHLMIKIQKFTSNIQSAPASLQIFIDMPNCVLEDRVQYSTVHIPSVFCDGQLQIGCVGIGFCTVIVRCTETFWSPCTNKMLLYLKVQNIMRILHLICIVI
jgi:hypothetical protein